MRGKVLLLCKKKYPFTKKGQLTVIIIIIYNMLCIEIFLNERFLRIYPHVSKLRLARLALFKGEFTNSINGNGELSL